MDLKPMFVQKNQVQKNKVQKTVSYLTHSKKKRLKNFFDNDENKTILSIYLNIIKRKRIYYWSKFKE